LPWSVTVDQVRELVESAAPAARRIGFPVDHKDRSRGFAIVEMNSTKDADILIAALDGRELGKRKLHVRFDQFSEK
jgi:RNA recognition motif-containing protein